MDYRNLKSKVLEDSNKVSMMIFLLVEGKSKKSAIYNGVTRSTTQHLKLDALRDVGWITMEHRPFESNVTYVELTPEGRIVAQKLLDIENSLTGEDVQAKSD